MRNTLTAVLLCCLLLVGCTQPTTFQATNDGVSVTVTTEVVLVANAVIPLTLSFTRDGAPYAVSDVAVELLMPGMVMGKTVPLAEQQADGTHSVDVLFTMDGEWSLVVTGTSQRGAERFVITPVIVAP